MKNSIEEESLVNGFCDLYVPINEKIGLPILKKTEMCFQFNIFEKTIKVPRNPINTRVSALCFYNYRFVIGKGIL